MKTEQTEGERMIHETPILLAAAMVAHEANRAYCATLGDDSQVPWDEAPAWQRDSAVDGVCAIQREPDLHPEGSHEGWLAQKEADGWVYGEVKDAEAKTHPCMVPYDELPDEQRMKDTLFGAVVRAVLFDVSGREAMDRDTEEDPSEDEGEAEDDVRGLEDLMGEMTAKELANRFGLTRMMGPDPDHPMVAEDGFTEARGDFGEPGQVIREDGPVSFRQPIGATFDGEGVTVVFEDGETARFRTGQGWNLGQPIPGTYAAKVAERKAAGLKVAEEVAEG